MKNQTTPTSRVDTQHRNIDEITADQLNHAHFKPLDLLNHWPRPDLFPICLLHAGRFHKLWSRWSIFGIPTGFLACSIAQHNTQPIIKWRPTPHAVKHHRNLPATFPTILSICNEPHNVDPIDILTRVLPPQPNNDPSQTDATTLPFTGGWIGYLAYELGAFIEPAVKRATRHSKPPHPWPLYELAYCPDALLYDHQDATWHQIGRVPFDLDTQNRNMPQTCFSLTPLKPSQSRGRVEASVAKTINYIHAGDIFQANITQQLTATFQGDSRATFIAAMNASPAWYAAYFEPEADRRLISISPELFLQVDPSTRIITTRPIKGTAPSTQNPACLENSNKDAAELNMIVDLMRNDLGRICDYGSVKVTQPRTIETHPTIHHGVATIKGHIKDHITPIDIIRATFPGGSITGAPKIRAMQIIDELEPLPRGPYCGAIGYFSNSGSIGLNIAIRTMTIQNNQLTYAAGAGIVADSDPSNEYDEMLDKATAIQLITSTE